MDIILLREVRADTIVGVYEWERTAPQPIEIDLDIGIPSGEPCHSDNIADTIDYGAVVDRLRKALADQNFLLLEALAEYIAKVILYDFGAPWSRVSVTKLGILPGVKRVGVMIERGQRLP